ncbi:MAG: site-specific integrase [Acidiferrobacter sp.]
MGPASRFDQAFERACEASGIEGLTFHDLRHEATSRLFEKGLNPMQVAAITGHKTLQMLKRYTHTWSPPVCQAFITRCEDGSIAAIHPDFV